MVKKEKHIGVTSGYVLALIVRYVFIRGCGPFTQATTILFVFISLGVIYHDGDDNTVSRHCPRELNYIMAPSSAIINSKTKEYSFKFSDCSIAQMEDHVNLLTQR